MKNKHEAIEMVKLNAKNPPLTLDERKKIKEGLELNLSYTQLAKHVGRNKSTVLRESKRLGTPDDYDPEKAQAHFEMRQQEKIEGIKRTLREKRKALAFGRNESRPRRHTLG